MIKESFLSGDLSDYLLIYISVSSERHKKKSELSDLYSSFIYIKPYEYFYNLVQLQLLKLCIINPPERCWQP